MQEVHTITYDVRPYEAGYGRRIRPEALLNFFQDAAYGHSIAGGFSAPDLFRTGLTWVLSRYHVRVERYPSTGERVHVRTWYPGPQRPFHLREWEAVDDDGEILALATSSWLMLELATMKPVDDKGRLDGVPRRPERAIEDGFGPLPELHNPSHEARFRVRISDTDLNRHVNHVLYVQWALETVVRQAPAGAPGIMEVDYKAEARLGDEVVALAYEDDRGVYVHRLSRASDGAELTRLRTVWL